MAIDTREKRQSACWIYPGLAAPSVTPNSGKDQEWRQQAGWGYSGILALAPGGISIMPIVMLQHNHFAGDLKS